MDVNPSSKVNIPASTGQIFTSSDNIAHVSKSLDNFLASVEKRAFVMARTSTGNPDAALDIVQDAMLKLVKNYREYPAQDWPPLFYRILSNTITDWHRGRQRNSKIFDNWIGPAEEVSDQLDSLPAAVSAQPEQLLCVAEHMHQVESAIEALSPRQQQAFMLRCWVGFNTAESAAVMDCSEGTVKTLYSRAMQTIRLALTVSEPEPQTIKES